MATARSVVINGDLGSGKSTVSRLLARRLGVRRISIGHLYRDMAAQRGLTALELNRHAELDDTIDRHVDQLQREIASSGETVVVDSRLAWFFFREALKVHLVVDPAVAANRVLTRPADTVETYASATEALARLAQRSESERVRFLERYGADKSRLRNYDVVCDSTRASPREIVACIGDVLAAPTDDLRLFVDPQRIHRTIGDETYATCIGVGYARPHLFAVDGGAAVDDAVHERRTLVPATLLAEADEPIGSRRAEEYLVALGRRR
jgi:predicted cytidylate kinase